MASLSAYFSYDTNTIDRGIPYAQFTAFQYNTGGNAWYNPTARSSSALFATGYNLYGQLGLGNSGAGTDRNTFTQLTGNWSQLIGGGWHTMALSAGTTTWFGTGSNMSGQLGLGNKGFGTERTTLTQLTGNWSQVACGGGHTMAIGY